MKLIAITGNIAVGKTTVLKIINKLGYPTISCDDVYHKLLKTNTNLKKKLISKFGKNIIYGNEISTKKLAEILIKNNKNIQVLEKIVHPFIINTVLKYVKKLKNKNYKFCIVDVPLLFEKNLQNMFDYIITVVCSKKIQKQRLKKRKINKKLLKILLSRQLPMRKKLAFSNFIIYNNNIPKSKLKKQIIKILNSI